MVEQVEKITTYLKDMFKTIGIVVILLIIVGVFIRATSSESQSDNAYQSYQSNSNYESASDTTGYATKNYGTTDAQCDEVKRLCNEALGEYASYKAQESTYTKYESNKKVYYELIRRYEEEIFPKCKERLAECK